MAEGAHSRPQTAMGVSHLRIGRLWPSTAHRSLGKDTTPGAGPSTDKLRSNFTDFEWFFEACSADRLFLGKSRKFIENRPFHT